MHHHRMKNRVFEFNRDILVVTLLPNVISIAVYALFANIYQDAPEFVVGFVALVTAACILVASQLRHSTVVFSSAICCLVAVACSTVVGLISYEAAFTHYSFLKESNSYANVLATESAAGYADAGKIVFADGTRVDTGRSVGYKDVETYCVAPIVDEMSTGSVEFWAVGIDCCGVRGGFQCDDVGTSRARSGAAVHDTTGNLARAVRQAEAAFEIAASTKPLFVRWVVDPEKVQWNYRIEGLSILVCGFLVQVLLYSLGVMWLDSFWSLDFLMWPR